jgi:osmotically-inducible protein OsmY
MRRKTDTQLLTDVRAALGAAPVDEMAIDVEIVDHAVHLRGAVSTHSERLAALTAAKSAASSAPVISLLRVEPSAGDHLLTDGDVAVEVARALVQSDVPPGSVWFDVKNRIVTLEGHTATGAERARIRHIVQRARGVHFIDNRIVVGVPAAGRGVR